jgi:hypothetical protein
MAPLAPEQQGNAWFFVTGWACLLAACCTAAHLQMLRRDVPAARVDVQQLQEFLQLLLMCYLWLGLLDRQWPPVGCTPLLWGTIDVRNEGLGQVGGTPQPW